MLTLTKRTYGEVARWEGSISIELDSPALAREVAAHFLVNANGNTVIRDLFSCKDKDEPETELEAWAKCVTQWVQDNDGWLRAVVALREEVASIKHDLELAFRCK